MFSKVWWTLNRFLNILQVNREVRPRDVVAIISNCEDTNPYSRLKYIEDMRSSTPELQIDIYGKCGEKGLYEGSKHVCNFWIMG